MHGFCNLREQSLHAFVDEGLEVCAGLLICEIQFKFFLNLVHAFVRLVDVGNVGIDHECEQVQNQIRRFAQNVERLATVRPKLIVIDAIFAAHAFNHFLTQFLQSR